MQSGRFVQKYATGGRMSQLVSLGASSLWVQKFRGDLRNKSAACTKRNDIAEDEASSSASWRHLLKEIPCRPISISPSPVSPRFGSTVPVIGGSIERCALQNPLLLGVGFTSFHGSSHANDHIGMAPTGASGMLIASAQEDAWTTAAPVTLVHDGVVALHSSSGLSWAATIALSTFLMRVSLLPISVLSERNAVRFAQHVTPEVRRLHAEVTPRDAQGRIQIASARALAEGYGELLRRIHALAREYNCPLYKTLLSPFLQLPFFITLSLALRKLVVEGKHAGELAEGGHLWFTDLTAVACDEFLKLNTEEPLALILPVAATSLSLLNVELAFGNRFLVLKKVLQLLPIVFLPVTYQLPTCLFVYWVSSFALTTTHILARRLPWYRARVALDPAFRPLEASPAVEVKEAAGSAEEPAADRHHLRRLLRDAETRYQDDPQRLKGEHVQILVKQMRFEREVLLPRLVQEVSSGRVVDEALCREIEDAIQQQRRQGKILALPPVQVLREAVTVADEATQQPEKRFRLRLAFLTPDGPTDAPDVGGTPPPLS